MAARMGVRAGHRVISVDRIPERLARVSRHGAETLHLDEADQVGGVAEVVRESRGRRRDGQGSSSDPDPGPDGAGGPGGSCA